MFIFSVIALLPCLCPNDERVIIFNFELICIDCLIIGPCNISHTLQTKQQVLLVFPKNDDVCDMLQDACSRLEMDTFLSQTLPEAIESFQNITNGGHNLVIVDGRLPQMLDPESVARYILFQSSRIYTNTLQN